MAQSALFARLSRLWAPIAALTDGKFYGFRNGQIVEQPYYESAQTTWTAGGLLTFTHGLGVKPRFVQLTGVITTAQDGVPVGTEFDVPLVYTSAYFGAQCVNRDAIIISVRCATYFLYLQSGSSAYAIQPANCRIIARAIP